MSYASYPHDINSLWKPSLIPEHDFPQVLPSAVTAAVHNFPGCMPKTISYLDFPLHVQFFSNFMQLEYRFSPFLGNLWTFPLKIFHKNRASLPMKAWTLLTSHTNALAVGLSNAPFPSSLPTPQSRIQPGLWSILNTTNVIYTFRFITLTLGNFLSAWILLSLPLPWPGIEGRSPWVSWNTGRNSLAIIASPVRLRSSSF